jgi:hypothetical protein
LILGWIYLRRDATPLNREPVLRRRRRTKAANSAGMLKAMLGLTMLAAESQQVICLRCLKLAAQGALRMSRTSPRAPHRA